MEVYSDLEFPPSPAGRPYCFVNMVATIDGKILSGSRDDHVLDLGSSVDHQVMKRLESFADGLLVGGQTLRTTLPKWSPSPEVRIVVTKSGRLPYESRFFEGGRPLVVMPENSPEMPPNGIETIHTGKSTVDFKLLFGRLRTEFGIRRLIVLGGSELNAQLLEANLVDELFVTIAPKVKLGRDVPTYADGNALPREHLQQYNLVEHHAVRDEIFIRYRRNWEPEGTQNS